LSDLEQLSDLDVSEKELSDLEVSDL